MDSLINGIFGLAGAGLSNAMAKQRESEARQENFKYGEMAANAADQRTRALYNDLYSLQALMQQAEKAGLSPSIFANNISPGTGTSGAMGTGATGISPTTFGVPNIDYAQIKLMNAQARKLNVEADEALGNTEKGQAIIEQVMAKNGLYKAQEAYTNAQKNITEIDTYIRDNTKDLEIWKAETMAETAWYNSQKAQYDTIKAMIQAGIEEERIKSEIDRNTADIKVKNSEVLLNNAKIGLTEAEKQKTINEINVMNEELQVKWSQISIECANAENQRQSNRIQEKYYDEFIENLENRLDFDKGKWSDEKKIEWTKTINTIVQDTFANYNQAISNTIGALDTLLPIATKKPVGTTTMYIPKLPKR